MADRPRMPGVLRGAWWRKQFTAGRLIGIVVMLALCVVRGFDPGPLQVARARTFDLYQNMKPQPKPRISPVSIVDIDEDSIHEIGQWPWPRTLMAKMIDNLTQAGAVVIGLDIFFPEPDRLSPMMVAKELTNLDDDTKNRLMALPSNDEVFAAAMKRGNVVLGQTGIDLPPRRTTDIPPVPTVAVVGEADMNPLNLLQHFTSILRSTPVIDFAAKGWGVVATDPEADGIVRRVPAMVTDGKGIYPSLSLEMLRVALGNQSLGIRTGPDGIEGVIVRQPAPTLVPTDAKGDIWVYAAPHDQSLYIPARDVINGTFDKSKVNGKLILVGTSAAGLQDIRSTAIERFIPGVEVHAEIIDTIIGKWQLSNPPFAPVVELTAAIIGALLMIVLVPIIGARWTLLLFLVTAAGMGGFSWYEFSTDLTLYDPVFPAVTTLITFMLMTYTSYASEEKQKRQVRAAFNRYLAPAVVEQVAADPSRLKLGGETRDMTLLFCDIRGFTTISEMFDAQGLTHLINRFLTPMTDIILARRGAIDKYMGDCIMAYWNAPLDDDQHAAHACASALAMNERLGPLNDELEAEAKANNRRHVPIKIGIGLNSGPVVVGNVGSDQFFGYSSLGDNVNLASRLEGQSKGYGVIIVIGENTRERAPDFAALELDLIKVKGKTEAVRIYTLSGSPEEAKAPEFLALLKEHDAALAAYRGQQWAKARELFAKCRALCEAAADRWRNEHYYEIMTERIDEYEQNPPGANWDGVYVATSK